jgi:cyclopropane fatty-acyl-phospholipid synthase-like methyltransferase
MDSARAYELHARKFLEARDRSRVGAEIVAQWAGSLAPGTEVVEIACGGGYPVTRALVQSGLSVWAIDASPTLLRTFRSRFPDIPTRCSSVLDSDYFERKFGASIAIGLIFLLEDSEQTAMLLRVSEILLPGGRFLFTAPVDVGTWQDVTTGRECRSLGRHGYLKAMSEAGLRLVGTHVDEGENHYYEAEKVNGPS